MELHEYPKIRDLPKVPELFAFREVIATEKIHGMNWRIGVPDSANDPGELVLGTRTLQVDGESASATRFVTFTREQLPVAGILDAVRPYRGHKVLYGELFGPGVQKGIKYREEGLEFRLFDVFVGGKYFLNRDELEAVARQAGLQLAPVVWRGLPTHEALDALLEMPSTVGVQNGVATQGNLAEGVVLKPDPPFQNRWGEWVVAKHKHEKWLERNPRAPKPAGPDAGALEVARGFVEQFIVPVRVSKMVDKLKERGEHTASVKDIGPLVRLILEDLKAEEAEEFTKVDERALGKYAGTAVARVYRAMLDEGA